MLYFDSGTWGLPQCVRIKTLLCLCIQLTWVKSGYFNHSIVVVVKSFIYVSPIIKTIVYIYIYKNTDGHSIWSYERQSYHWLRIADKSLLFCNTSKQVLAVFFTIPGALNIKINFSMSDRVIKFSLIVSA